MENFEKLTQYGALGLMLLWLMWTHTTTLKSLRQSNHDLRNAIMEFRAFLMERYGK